MLNGVTLPVDGGFTIAGVWIWNVSTVHQLSTIAKPNHRGENVIMNRCTDAIKGKLLDAIFKYSTYNVPTSIYKFIWGINITFHQPFGCYFMVLCFKWEWWSYAESSWERSFDGTGMLREFKTFYSKKHFGWEGGKFGEKLLPVEPVFFVLFRKSVISSVKLTSSWNVLVKCTRCAVVCNVGIHPAVVQHFIICCQLAFKITKWISVFTWLSFMVQCFSRVVTHLW